MLSINKSPSTRVNEKGRIPTMVRIHKSDYQEAITEKVGIERGNNIFMGLKFVRSIICPLTSATDRKRSSLNTQCRIYCRFLSSVTICYS